MFACGPKYEFEQKYELPTQEWAYSDTLDFQFEIEDTLRIYGLYLQIDHSIDYSFQNLYTRIFTKFPTGERINEVVSMELADKAGVWYGKCRGEACSLRIPIQEGAYFDIPGTHVITLEQFMRSDSLPGIHAISFLLEDTGKRRNI
ncbi:MAG: gliding motility lipoprotein GldH [Desulfobulbaceae bacterium]|nr:gliding motility lipoprotein GldH [Desulfobulbaceae bacterium]